jgi:hypothetical protein
MVHAGINGKSVFWSTLAQVVKVGRKVIFINLNFKVCRSLHPLAFWQEISLASLPISLHTLADTLTQRFRFTVTSQQTSVLRLHRNYTVSDKISLVSLHIGVAIVADYSNDVTF